MKLSTSTLVPATGVSSKTCIIVGNPFWRYPIAVSPPAAATRPLLEGIRAFEHRPYRIISHVAEDGRVFNASFFDSAQSMREFVDWYAKNALEPGSPYHSSLADAAAPGTPLPTAESLLFGRAEQVLHDTRFGEYQLGMAVRYSVARFRSAEMAAEAKEIACTSAFERRIARQMHDTGLSYFGRLVMATDELTWLTASRYGSLSDAHAATAVIQQTAVPGEMERWFSRYDSIYGTASRLFDTDSFD